MLERTMLACHAGFVIHTVQIITQGLTNLKTQKLNN